MLYPREVMAAVVGKCFLATMILERVRRSKKLWDKHLGTKLFG